MAGETWQTPKTDWVFGEAVPTTWLNKIEGNLVVEHRGGGYIVPVTIEPDVTGVLDIGETNNAFLVGGENDLYYITTTGRQFGNTIHLIRTASTAGLHSCQPNAGASAPSGTLPIYYNEYTAVEILTWYPGRKVTLTLGVLGWHHDMTVIT